MLLYSPSTLNLCDAKRGSNYRQREDFQDLEPGHAAYNVDYAFVRFSTGRWLRLPCVRTNVGPRPEMRDDVMRVGGGIATVDIKVKKIAGAERLQVARLTHHSCGLVDGSLFLFGEMQDRQHPAYNISALREDPVQVDSAGFIQVWSAGEWKTVEDCDALVTLTPVEGT